MTTPLQKLVVVPFRAYYQRPDIFNDLSCALVDKNSGVYVMGPEETLRIRGILELARLGGKVPLAVLALNKPAVVGES